MTNLEPAPLYVGDRPVLDSEGRHLQRGDLVVAKENAWDPDQVALVVGCLLTQPPFTVRLLKGNRIVRWWADTVTILRRVTWEAL